MMLMDAMNLCIMRVKKKILTSILILIIVLIILNIKQHLELGEKSLIIKELNSNYSDLMNKYGELISKYEMLLSMINLTNKGAIISSSYGLGFSKISEKEFSANVHAIIYNPIENSKLNLFLWDIFPENKIFVPLCVQLGYATKREEATEVWDKYHKVAPIIWALNATEKGRFSITLPYKGWYTVSILGPIQIGPTTWGYIGPFPIVEGTVRAHLLITITHDGRSIPFAVLGS